MFVPILELLKIPSQRASFFRALGMLQQKDHRINHQDKEIRLKDINCYMTNENHESCFLTLDINDRFCMLDSGSSKNVMTMKVMEQLKLRISRPDHNICSMDSRKDEFLGVVKVYKLP